jgi:sphingomyelin phosphodiesterase acid-like 3
MLTSTVRRSCCSAFFTLTVYALAATSLLPAQSVRQPTPPPTPIHALFLSDIHFDPFNDPAKVARLNAEPAAEWHAIFDAPSSTTQLADSAALQKTCSANGADTSNVLWQSSLEAIHADAANARFVTISGDLLAHKFDCKYKALLPAASHADYVSFVEKTIRFEIAGLRAAVSSVPIYTALGNNDSGCGDYQLDTTQDDFLALIAKIVSEFVPEPDRASVLRDFAADGSYSASLAAVSHTRLVVLDDLYLSAKYATCSGKPDPAPATAQFAWLNAQLAAAREHHEHVWVMGHIPPGVDLYSTARKLTNVCAGGKPQMFLGSEKLAEILAANSDVVRLALFGHTHSDEMRLLTPEISGSPGVPLKITASITPVNGNRPTFTLATIDPATATLTDYTVMIASNSTGIDTTWSKEYTYSAAYHQPAFTSAALTSLISGFQADPSASTPASQAYLHNYFPGDASSMLQLAWHEYACSLNHDSAQTFTACTCPATK